ncbi:MAG: glycosyltransferase [Bacteroidia bacterium]
MQSEVFTDETFTYKVMVLDCLSYTKKKLVENIRNLMGNISGSAYFWPILDIIQEKDAIFLISPYEEFSACQAYEEKEIQDFLVECWQRRVIFKDIKPSNFIRVGGKLKLVDIDPSEYTDNLFLNMAARAFIYVKYVGQPSSFLAKLCQSAINNFELPELEGFQAFTNRVFAKVIYRESEVRAQTADGYTEISTLEAIGGDGTYKMLYQDSLDAEFIFWQLLKRGVYLRELSFDTPVLDSKNCFSPKYVFLRVSSLSDPLEKVSLVIKACVQDSEIIYQAVKHIVKQLSTPHKFDEKILALDIRKENFLREYNSKGRWEDLVNQAERLVREGIIDKYVFPTQDDIEKVNLKYFGLKTLATHTYQKAPVTAQLYAFEVAKNDFILQVDCDAMIGRLSQEHAFLNDMILEIEKNPKVLSVGFNIYKGQEAFFEPYFGFENGGFVPEVRCCLLKKSRIEKLLPLKNALVEDTSFTYTWYRALEQRQKETGTCSIRGGDSRSFFIHPENYRKKDKDVWFTQVDRVEKLFIPPEQRNEWDLQGSYYDWTGPKRNEPMVIVSCFRNLSLSRFLRYWYSLISQTYQEWGLILIDDASDNGIDFFIETLIRPYQHKVTFVQNRFRLGIGRNTYKAIHYFMGSQESVVCILNADDALIGRSALETIWEKYAFYGADVVIGKMYRTDKISPEYLYNPDFLHPRVRGGNVWQHIRTFKKYLYDSLSLEDLTFPTHDSSLRFSTSRTFIEYASDYAFMVPIIEMAQRPMRVNGRFNLFYDRTGHKTEARRKLEEEIISYILNKPPKSPEHVFRGRKRFFPNLHEIEIDITYECNLKCLNCNRSSTQAPTQEGMTLAQIQRFIQESIELGKKWQRINLLGGEPTLHKDFLEIVKLILNEYILKHSPKTLLQITSNGYGQMVQERLSQLPKHENIVIDYASFKEDRVVSYFSPFNDAPIDQPDGDQKEYYKGCWVTAYCGIGLNHLGYYPCGVAAGIDRVLRLNLGIQSLREVDENIANHLNIFCRYCGNFTDYEKNFGDFIPRHEKGSLRKSIISPTWIKAYRAYNKKNNQCET